ncbi:hypothetical protein SAMN05192559_11628 [Halobacillus karajensis]|nr:hypothetical protein SAMN05192559_11628 [Halobacillus karajensis]
MEFIFLILKKKINIGIHLQKHNEIKIHSFGE